MGGHSVTQEPMAVRNLIGVVPQELALYDDLTAWENLVFYGGIYGIRDRKRIEATLTLVGLTEHKTDLARGLSAGWRQRLALAIALVHQPKLLFLDEPTSGVDPSARRSFWDLIYTLAAEGVTILVTTHYMDEAEYCGRVGMMREGRLLALDTPAVLKKQAVPGDVWEVSAGPLQVALNAHATCVGVLRVGLAGDHLRMITERGLSEDELRLGLKSAGLRVERLERGEPTLEDVFLSLAKG